MDLILFNLIEKEIVQFFKSKYNLFTMFILPIILIFVLGIFFNDLISIDSNIFDNKIIYYRINIPIKDKVDLQRFYDFIINFQKSTNVNFIENNNYQESIMAVNSNKAICFIDIYDNNINYFRNEKKESIESKIFRNLYEQYIKKYTFLQSIYKLNPQEIESVLDYEIKILLNNEKTSLKKLNSFTYYTFSILVLIILYISNITFKSMYNCTASYITTRSIISTTNNINILLSKISLGMIVGIIQISIVYLISSMLLNVNWGLNLFYIFIVLMSLVVFSSVLGIFIFVIFSDKNIAYIVNNILIIVMGFLGGSYVPVCLVKSARVTSFLAEYMPSYWANISLISLSYNIQIKYYIISIFISLGLSALVLILLNLRLKLREGVSFD